MSMWFPTVCHITAIILAANKDLAESNRISVRLIIDPIIWQSGEPKVSPGEHDRKQNVSGWQKHASDLVKAVLVAVVMETEVGGRVVTVPLVEVMSVWHVGSSEVLHCNNKASYTVWYVILEFHKGFVQKKPRSPTSKCLCTCCPIHWWRRKKHASKRDDIRKGIWNEIKIL